MSWAQVNAALQYLVDQRYEATSSEDEVFARTKAALGG